ncbi:Cytochrome P450 [Naviculisporaceae sp. PSN 640]
MAFINTHDGTILGRELNLSNVSLLVIFVTAILYPITRAIYNVCFHPLSKIPGPILWSASRLPYVRSLIRGNLVHDIQKFHAQYGPIVRVTPNEVAFAQPEAWTDIYQSRYENDNSNPSPGGQAPTRNYRGEFRKDPSWWAPPTGNAFSVITATDPEQHARFRKILAPAFTPRALKAQEPFLHRYVNLLVERLREAATSPEQEEVDMHNWFNFTTFDIFGDLGFGESFKCLENSQYHPWIHALLGSIKAIVWLISARWYPTINYLLLLCIPPSLKKMAEEHDQQVKQRVRRRMNYEMDRPDVFAPILAAQKNGNGMTQDEIDITFSGLVTAGSETSATTLTGTMNYLVQDPRVLGLLTEEIRTRFKEESEITLEALRDLPYLDHVLHEGLRLCAPVPWILPRVVPPEGAVVCGVFLPGGTTVSVQAYTMNRTPEYWHQADKFIPERWQPEVDTDESSPFHKDRRDAWQPFLLGSRGCLGQNLAWAELRLIMAKLVWNFDFEMSKDPARRLNWEKLKTHLLVETEPVWVRIRPREAT